MREVHRGFAIPSRPAVRRQPPAPSGIRDQFGPAVDDLYLVTRFAGYGQMFRMMGERLTAEHEANPPLADKPAVQLQRPFMIVPGWTTRKAELEPLGHKLSQDGRNGGQIAFVQNGEFFADEACTQALTVLSPDQKVFQTVLTDIRMPPPLAAVEVAKNLAAVQQLTGSDKVDVTGFSMGGLATRVYLDRGGSAIGKFMLLGTPNQGTTFANLARQVLERDIKFAISMAGLTPGDLPALEWLSVESGNPHLQELNRNWDRQAAQVETTLAVGGRGLLTPSRSGIGITLGDGLVEAEGMAPPGGAVKILEGEHHHAHLPNDADVYDTMIDFFGWQPAFGR